LRRNPWAVIALSAISIAAAETSFHWLLSRSPSSTLTAIYLPSNYTTSRDDFAGVVDTLLPAVVLGLAIGWAAFPRWSVVKVTWILVGGAAFVAALEPLYWALIGWNHYYGVHKPTSLHEALALFPLLDFCMAYGACWFFANLVYRGRRELARSKSKSLPK
jgi:hypothetical protein